MRRVNHLPSISIAPSLSPFSSLPAKIDGHDPALFLPASWPHNSSPATKCHGFLYDAALLLPSALFILYLGFQGKKNIKKVRNCRSHIMIAYYLLLWFSALLNLAWSSLQTWQCMPEKAVGWNLLSLLTTSGMLYLEISLLAFLLKENYATGLETLTRNFIASGIIVGVDVFLKAIFVFGFGVPMFIDVETTYHGKWALWFINKLLLTSVYGFILFAHFSKWSNGLPPRPTFYNYIIVMFAFSAVTLFACGLAWFEAGFGLWLYSFTNFCYHSLYLPFLYITFLSDFFQEEDLLLDNAYYSEMKDAGFFDADWENS